MIRIFIALFFIATIALCEGLTEPSQFGTYEISINVNDFSIDPLFGVLTASCEVERLSTTAIESGHIDIRLCGTLLMN